MAGRRLAVALPPPPIAILPPAPPPPPSVSSFDVPGRQPSPSLASIVSSDFAQLPRYRCCCRLIHLRTAAFVIGLVDTLSISAAFGRGLHLGLSMQHNPMAIGWFVISSLMFVLGFLCTLAMFYGVWRETYLWIVPKLVMKISAVILYSATTIGLVYIMMEHSQYLLDLVAEHITKSDYEAARIALRTGGGGLVVAFLLMSIIHIWFFHVLYRCYKYLKDRYFWKKSQLTHVECNDGHVMVGVLTSSFPVAHHQYQSNGNGDHVTYVNTNGNIDRNGRGRDGTVDMAQNATVDQTDINRPVGTVENTIERNCFCRSPNLHQSPSDNERQLLLWRPYNQTNV